MSEIRIPPAALEAGALVIFLADEDTPFGDTARAAFVAMVTAWEGMHMEDESAPWVPRLILPLTEKQDGSL